MGYDTTIIEEIRFTNRTFGGYDTDEVDEFLDELVVEIENLNQQIEDLAMQLTAAQSTQTAVAEEKKIVEEVKAPTEIPALVPQPQSVENINQEIIKMKEILSDTLVTAQKTADQVISAARVEADNLIIESHEKSKSALRTVSLQLEQAEDELNSIHDLAYTAKEKYIKDFSLQLRTLEAIKIDYSPYKQKNESTKAEPEHGAKADNVDSAYTDAASGDNNEKYIIQALSAYDNDKERELPKTRSSLTFEVPKSLAGNKTEKPMLSSVIEGILNNNDKK